MPTIGTTRAPDRARTSSGETRWTTYWNVRRDAFAAECEAARADLLADLADPDTAQARVLEDIVTLGADSVHWRESGYDAVADTAPGTARAEAFRRLLPIMRYDDFAPLVERETLAKGGVLSCSPVLRWLKTSGTTGNSKRVPYTRHWLTSYRIPAMQAMWGTYLALHPEILDGPYATLDTQTVREGAADFIEGVAYQAVSNRHPRLGGLDWNPPWYEAPWMGPDTPTSHEGRMYHRVRHLLGRPLQVITAINPSTLISLRDLISEFGDRLVDDVRAGTLDGLPWGEPDIEGADRLQLILKEPHFALTDIWPTLRLYSCWLSASAGLYQRKLDKILPGVARLPFMSCGTEGVTTLPVDGSADAQPLAVSQAFFEFVPADVPLAERIAASEPVRTLLFDEVEPGADYHLIMSQGNGLYRLWTGDLYRVHRVVDGVPWVSFVRRDGSFHSFTGEKLTEGQVTDALRRGFADLGLDMGLYLCGPQWAEPPHYVAVVETRDEDTHRAAEISARVDDVLREINIEYGSKRDSRRLDPIQIHLVPRDAVGAYVESRRQQGNAAQYKYKPFHTDAEFITAFTGSEGDVRV
ncbi:GH3 family domain-containing protein [Streptomyces fractus]|uniref:GH3 family domain-containing protein n=1 Tax=Streptomyces fractus TaxID=641806 RepID=UPI003CEA974A